MDEKSFFLSLRPERNIYICGSGDFEKLLYHRMTDYGISLKAFVDYRIQQSAIEGVPVVSMEVCAEQDIPPQLISVAVELQEKLHQKMIEHGLDAYIVQLPAEVREDMVEKQAQKDILRPQIMCRTPYWKNMKPFRNAGRILLVSPHPDDEVISCGGALAKYGSKIDVLCINSSGVNYGDDQPSAECVAENRIKEFYKVMECANVHDAWIAKIWGIPPMFQQIEQHIEEYKRQFDFTSYDVILVPGANDDHREHRYIANWIIPRILLDTGYRESLLVLRYDAWAPLEKANSFLDISKVIEKKKELIQLYTAGRAGEHWERISALNKYRGRQLHCAYAEA